MMPAIGTLFFHGSLVAACWCEPGERPASITRPIL